MKLCQEGWHRPALSLFAKVSLAFSCALPKIACFQNFLLIPLDFVATHPNDIPQRTAWNVHFKKPTASYTDLFAQLEATNALTADSTHEA